MMPLLASFVMEKAYEQDAVGLSEGSEAAWSELLADAAATAAADAFAAAGLCIADVSGTASSA